MGLKLPLVRFNSIIFFAFLLIAAFVPSTSFSQSSRGIASNDDTDFVPSALPTLAFSTSSTTVSENSGFATLTVKLVESNNSQVSVDVVFLNGSSTADSSDIGHYTTQTVTFEKGNTSGATRTVKVNLSSDSEFEEDEIAVFQLRNNTAGSIINPGVVNLTILDDDAPAIVINEINADPAGDADGNRVVNDEDEFVEFVNTSESDIDISLWTFSVSSILRHTFPEGTVIPASGALVLFANDKVRLQGGYGGAVVQRSNESPTLNLDERQDTITLQDKEGNEIVSINYSKAANNQSINLDPELNTKSNYSDHSAISRSGRALFSPGTRVDGTAFGATFATAFRGAEGYRLVSTPADSTSFNDLFADFRTQGIPGSDLPSATNNANILSWQETGTTFTPVPTMDTELVAGQGYMIYLFEDDNFTVPGIQGGFPKVISSNNVENKSPVSVPVSANDENESGIIDGNEGLNLLGNPYGTDISVDAVIDALRTVNANINANILVWDAELGSGNGGYVTLFEGAGARIAPFQAFFVRYTQQVEGNVIFDRNDLTTNIDAPYFGRPTEKEPIVSFEIYMGDGDKFDTYKVEFREEGTIGEDLRDAHKLFSLNTNSINLYSTVGEGVKLAKNVLPPISTLEGELRIPLEYNVPAAGEYTFSWNDIDQVPEQLKLYLVDNRTGREVNIRSQKELKLNISQEPKREFNRNEIASPALGKTHTNEGQPRFELLVVNSALEDREEEPLEQPITLSTNYPNPFSSQTTMDLRLREKMHVKMTVWNIVGQKVATMADQMMEAGRTHEMSWNIPASMPSGIYICKVEADGMVITRKMTLVK